MHRQPGLFAVGALALACAGCNSVSSTPEPSQREPSAVDVAAVKKLSMDYLDGWENKKPAVKDLYAEDAVLVLPEVAQLRGREQIAQSFERFAKSHNARFDGNHVMTVISTGGDMAYTQGTYRMTGLDPKTGKPENEQGYYILVYRKDAQGNWKVAQDVSAPLP